jgi:hypothetical protein
LQDRRVEALGEPAVDRREQVTGFGSLALIPPEAGKAGRREQLEDPCALAPRDRQRLIVRLLGCYGVAPDVEQVTSQPEQLGLVETLTSSFHKLRGFVETIEGFNRLAEFAVGFGLPIYSLCRAPIGSDTLAHRIPRSQQG